VINYHDLCLLALVTIPRNKFKLVASTLSAKRCTRSRFCLQQRQAWLTTYTWFRKVQDVDSARPPTDRAQHIRRQNTGKARRPTVESLTAGITNRQCRRPTTSVVWSSYVTRIESISVTLFTSS